MESSGHGGHKNELTPPFPFLTKSIFSYFNLNPIRWM